MTHSQDIWQLIGLIEWTVICLLIGIAVGVIVINVKPRKSDAGSDH